MQKKNAKKQKRVYKLLTAAVFDNLKKWINYYGDYDPEDLDKDYYAEYTQISFSINEDGRCLKMRPDGFPNIRSGIDIYIYNNCNVEVRLFCYPEESLITLMVFDEEEDVDDKVRQIINLFSVLIEAIILGYSVYSIERDLRNVVGKENYTWEDFMRDYGEQ